MSVSCVNEILRKFIPKFRLVQIFTQKMFRNVNFNLNFIKNKAPESIFVTIVPEASYSYFIEISLYERTLAC